MKHASIGLAIPLLAVVTLFTGCAAIVGGGTSQPVNFTSSPSGAHFTVKSSSGIQMADGTTPATITLPRKNEYQVLVAMDGYKPATLALTKSLNGWVFGNLFIGWIVGFIVDFASGAAYKLEPSLISVTLETAMLDDGSAATYAVARLLSKDGNLLKEQRARLVPDSVASSPRDGELD